MTIHDTQEARLVNLLNAVTDAMLTGEQPNLDAIFARYGLDRAEVEPLLRLIDRLQQTLVNVRPSRRYVSRLKNDLVGQPQHVRLLRLGGVPVRVQIVAALALIAGFVLLSRRRLLPDATEAQEAPAT